MKKTRKRKIKNGQVDFILLFSTLILVIIGIVMVFSSSWPDAMKKFGNQYHFVRRQIIFAILGFFAMTIVMNIDYLIYQRLALVIYVLSILTVPLLLFTPLGATRSGARRWINLGFISFMPGDVIKVGSIIFFANFLSKKRDVTDDFKQGTLPGLIIIGITAGSIILQQDLGTTITLTLTLISMFLVGGMNLKHFFSLALIGIIGIVIILRKILTDPKYLEDFRVRRIVSFLDPFADPQFTGFQVIQSLYALGTGGLFGLGLGKSKQKFFYLPEPYTDFIFSIIGEELGLIGAIFVITIYCVIIWRGVVIASNARDSFGMYLATGITALITIQTIIHIAVATSSIPTTGITLPFISYGGTSLLIYMVSVGILLNISRTAKINRS